MCVYLGTKFQVSSMILTTFRQGREEKPTQIRVNVFTTLSTAISDALEDTSTNETKSI